MSNSATRDRGGATVFVIMALTAMVIGLGFAVDVGQYVVAARSAQNTADATVLAVATDCATSGAPIADYSPYRKDGQTVSSPACGSGVAEITTTASVGGLLLRRSAGDVTRSAEARWGTLSQADTIPLVFSRCEFTQALLDGTTAVIFYLDDTTPQTGCSSLPGGFSQLESDGCEAAIVAGGYADGKPGADLQDVVPCITPLPSEVLVPLYDSDACAATDCKGNGSYPILGFAAIEITGYSFNGRFSGGTLGRNCPDRDRGRYCIQADFIRMTTSTGSPGSSDDFGVTQVYLSR